MRALIVVPARMASSRFPGKPLVDLGGKPMIQWVVEAAIASGVSERVVVATPDAEIMTACDAFGAEAILTRDDHPSGTDRIAEVADRIGADVYVNVQGDEPLVPAETIRACAQPLLDDPSIEMGSVFGDVKPEDVDNHAVVKVVTALSGDALYFSRFGIPFPRNERTTPLKRHVGMYAYRRDVLARFATWSQTPLELAESLEQLRFLENGVRIRMSRVTSDDFGVDTPEQAEAVRAILRSRNQ